MIVLDTNVLSETLKSDPSPRVLDWLLALREQPVTTIITKAELLAGVAILPAGQRRSGLEVAIHRALDQLGVCLPLTDAVVERYAEVVATRRAAGRPIDPFDALIAAICLDAGAALATRNTADFDGLGLTLVNPWDAEV
ncbi:type II toxin-antitoxin system VapC family toxin [Propioniciclava tarda]|uniref:Ribonuclease VapC n=1 Tax=Propioniciclava tarda TaxID=433330 RepID=A0A4Q9KPK5_PROTD|nr:type II toxin-antitoxin system VapC family toxin [Propioniciclava tarda]TBT96275.1 type II toxin-antitoxin system VapC family toxin [Propioniciclava tarda]SMO34673.1 hypothetical protein SAMN06266982_101202 [Propioniciclava tarda]